MMLSRVGDMSPGGADRALGMPSAWIAFNDRGSD